MSPKSRTLPIEERTGALDKAAAIAVDRRLAATAILQRVLTNLIDLSLQGKMAHWNLRGHMFGALHPLLDEVVDAAREYSDKFAERCLALGVAADGRADMIAKHSDLDPFPEGRVHDVDVVELMADRLHVVSEVGRARIGELGDLDIVSQDLANEMLEDIEKYLWMIESHRPPAPAS